MKAFSRIFCLLLALLLSLSLLSCNSQKTRERKVIATAAGYDVRYEELRYITLTYKDAFEATYGAGIWDDPATAESYRAELEETVYRILLNNYTVLAACAYYLPGITPETKEIAAAVDAQISSTMEECGGKSAFREELASLNMTESFLRFSLSVAEMENELYYVLTDDLGLIFDSSSAGQADFYDWLTDGNCVYVQHVFIGNDPGDDPEANRALAEEVRKNLSDGTKTIGDYINSRVNEDLMNAAPHFIVCDVYSPEMEAAAFALTADGAVSDVVETDTGYYVLVRIAYEPSLLLARLSDLLYSYQWAKVEATVEEFRAGISLDWNDYGKSIDLLAIE